MGEDIKKHYLEKMILSLDMRAFIKIHLEVGQTTKQKIVSKRTS